MPQHWPSCILLIAMLHASLLRAVDFCEMVAEASIVPDPWVECAEIGVTGTDCGCSLGKQAQVSLIHPSSRNIFPVRPSVPAGNGKQPSRRAPASPPHLGWDCRQLFSGQAVSQKECLLQGVLQGPLVGYAWGLRLPLKFAPILPTPPQLDTHLSTIPGPVASASDFRFAQPRQALASGSFLLGSVVCRAEARVGPPPPEGFLNDFESRGR